MDTVNSIDSKNRNLGEILFFSLFIPWIAMVILTQTTLYGKYLYKINSTWEILIHFLPLCVVTIKVLLVDKLELIPKLLTLLILYTVFAQFIRITYDDDLLLCVLFVISAYGIDFRKILKAYLLEAAILTAITTFASLIGWIPNIINHQYGRTRYAMGSIWCTDYAAKFFFMLLICLYLYSKKMKWFHWVGLLAICTTVFAITFGKLDFICMLLAIALFFFHELLQKHSGKLKETWEKLLEKCAVLFTPCAALLMTIITLVYTPSNSILFKLNKLLSGRLILGRNAFSNIKFTLIGQDIVWVGMGNISNDLVPKDYNFVDCSYLNILFTFGLLVILALIAMSVYLAYKNRKDHHFVLVVALISLNCMVAHHFIELAYNPFWVAILASMPIASTQVIRNNNQTEETQS